MVQDITKAPRIYGNYPLAVGTPCQLNDDHNHYLLSVMRKNDGDAVRVFNGRDGEFLGHIEKIGKKAAHLIITQQLYNQPEQTQKIALYFAPIKKDRLGFLIEKSVELGVTDLHPVMTDHTENRNIRADKMEKQIIEAAEQCERLDIPTLHPAITLDQLPNRVIFAALERQDATRFIPTQNNDIAVMIGPEGGWSDKEIAQLSKMDTIRPVSLGERILRAETAAIYMLSRI